MRATAFIDALSAISLKAVFNPYADRCGVHDREDAPVLRRSNLRVTLEAVQHIGVRSMWIARDLGYRGGRRTGLPLTDEVHLPAFSQALGGVPLSRATIGPPVAERTAAVIWDVLSRIQQPVFLWNVFPFHPFEPGDPLSNRCHSRKERLACDRLLVELLGMLAPRTIVAIGRDARLALTELGVPCRSVRHPSYGGQTAFAREIGELYGLNSAAEPKPALPFD